MQVTQDVTSKNGADKISLRWCQRVDNEITTNPADLSLRMWRHVHLNIQYGHDVTITDQMFHSTTAPQQVKFSTFQR